MSIHPDTLELIHADIDGVATPAQQAVLRQAIAKDPAVRDEYRRLRGLSELLARVTPEEPHPQLASDVLRRVRAQRIAPKAGFLHRLREAWPGGHVAIRYAYAVAAGALIGVVGLHMAGGSLFGLSVPERDASATLLPKASRSRLDLGPAGVQGFATLAPKTPGAAIGLDLVSDQPVDVVVHFHPTADGGRVDLEVVKDGQATPAGSLRLPGKER